jgi:hypothetical protein
MKKRKKHSAQKINGAFTPFLNDTIDSPAWRAMSHGAQSLYVRLRRRFNGTIDNNGKIFLPQRVAALEVNSNRDQIARWFRELQYYGFIVMASAGYLGVHGYGRAPSWRLTEVPCNGKPPTRDFLAWNGVPFETEPRPRNQGHGGPEIRAKGTAFPKNPLGPEIRAKGPAPKSGPSIESSFHGYRRQHARRRSTQPRNRHC